MKDAEILLNNNLWTESLITKAWKALNCRYYIKNEDVLY
jgi:hypothetical protein